MSSNTLTPQITTPIAEQAFNRVRTRLRDILECEVTNQVALRPDVSDQVIVQENRLTPMDLSEVKGVFINVRSQSIFYDQYNSVNDNGTVSYIIEIVTTSKATSTQEGSTRSGNKRDFYTGLVRAILRSDFYRTLGFDAGFIGSVKIPTMDFDLVSDKYIKNYETSSLVLVEVDMCESNDLHTGELIAGVDSQVFVEDGNNNSVRLTTNFN